MQIEWTDIALESLKDVIEYTKEQFGDSQVEIISHKILNTIDCITSLPTAFPIEPLLKRKKPIYRSAIVIKELKLFIARCLMTTFSSCSCGTHE